MRPDRALERLQEHQQQISAIVRDARPRLGDVSASEFKALALARWQLLRLLREYQLFKHTELFDPIIAVGADDKRLEAEQLKRQCLAIGERVNNHVQRWALHGPASSWTIYRSEALALLEALEVHLATERIGVARLLHGVERTRIG